MSRLPTKQKLADQLATLSVELREVKAELASYKQAMKRLAHLQASATELLDALQVVCDGCKYRLHTNGCQCHTHLAARELRRALANSREISI